MTTTNNTERAANLNAARPATAYTCHWCKAFNRAHTFCGCGESRTAHNERPLTIDIDAVDLTF